MPHGQHQAAKPFSGRPHPPQNSVCEHPWHHCRHSQDLPKLGSCREGTDPLNEAFINLGPLRSYKKLPHTTTAQGWYWSPALNKRKKTGNRTVDMKDPNRKCIFNVSTSSWHEFFLHEEKGFFPFISLNDWVLLVISPVRLYYVKHLGFETGIHKQRWQYSGFGNTSLFHKEKIVPRFTISRNTENLANTWRKEGKQKNQSFSS